ncbi:MAG: ShlB/FhaC/HecB family hemolysin secretion/activation protein, partial [Arenimonas sp.]
MKIRKSLLPLVLLAIAPSVLAQQIPGAGIQLRQVAPPIATPSEPPRIRIEQSSTASPTPAGGETTQVRVDRLEFAGQHIGSDAELAAVAGFKPGADVTLAQ